MRRNPVGGDTFKRKKQYYYLPGGNSIVEVRNGSDQVVTQYVWANLAGGYIDELLQIQHNGDIALDPNFDTTDPDHDARIFFAAHDIQYNVTMLLLGNEQTQFDFGQSYAELGDVVERYEYTPYGKRQVYGSTGINESYNRMLTGR